MGNVLVALNDKKLGVSSNSNTVDYFNPQVVSAQDYYPFGMLQPGRSYNTSGYRYGFNGKENDNEVKGEGEQVDYGMRVYDPRVGRFLSVDPFIKEFPELTPYQYASNTPIASIDLDGEESKVIIHVFGTTKNKPILTIVKVDDAIPKVSGIHDEIHQYKKFDNGKVQDIATFTYRVDEAKNKKEYLFGGLASLRNIFLSPFSTVYVTKEVRKASIDLKDKVTFISQFSLYPNPDQACCRASQKIIRDFGIKNGGAKAYRYLVGEENSEGNAIVPTEDVKTGVDYINSQLEKGNPVMVGMNHHFGKGQSDGEPADHYVVIVGRSFDEDKKQDYFLFYEVGAGVNNEEGGKSDKNRLYVNKDNTITGTNYAGTRNFSVTEVRKND